MAVFDPLALFDFGVSGAAGGDLDGIFWLPVVPSSDADSMSPPLASEFLLSFFVIVVVVVGIGVGVVVGIGVGVVVAAGVTAPPPAEAAGTAADERPPPGPSLCTQPDILRSASASAATS